MRVFDLFNDSDRNFLKPQKSPPIVEDQSIPNPMDKVTMDIPLLLRIMEYSKEDAKTDMDLHRVVEKLVELSGSGQTLNMNHYNDIVNDVHEGDAPAEKLIKDIEYHPDETEDEEDVYEGYGRYWCSTDKRWKERQGPKQSRG